MRPARRVLVLGGTAEARALAAAAQQAGWHCITSLAGRVSRPALPVGEVRIGGFGGPEGDGVGGLADYLAVGDFDALVDATHPFAATISAHAAAAAERTGIPLLRLQRPGWRAHPDAGRWTWADGADAAVAAGAEAARPLLTTGRQTITDFLAWSAKAVTVRVVDPPQLDLPPAWRVIRSRGPYGYAAERALLTELASDLLVTKDSGGAHTAAKLDVARDLGIGVVVIARPASVPGVTEVATVEFALGWLTDR